MSSQPAEPAIEATNVFKRFRLRSRSLKQALLDRGRPREEIWAIRDVSFDLSRGGSLGVVGDNGSGKSTLLRVLSGVMQPTSGTVRTSGRIGTLIEIGAGFHPDLSGRDNVFLNASLLGVRRADVRRKFDEIVSFAELERFIDTPVKRYSSGMFLRLGFSVAAHADADILLVDEVLAVGDATFQRKCMRRLREFRESGGTLVLVSHGLGLIVEHTAEAIWLDSGVVRAQGSPGDVADAYAQHGIGRHELDGSNLSTSEWGGSPASNVAGGFELVGVQLLDLTGQPTSRMRPGEAARVRVGYRSPSARSATTLRLEIVRNDGLDMFASTATAGTDMPELSAEGDIVVELPFLALAPGLYAVTISSSTPDLSGNGLSAPVSTTLEIDAGSTTGPAGTTFMPARWLTPSN